MVPALANRGRPFPACFVNGPAASPCGMITRKWTGTSQLSACLHFGHITPLPRRAEKAMEPHPASQTGGFLV